MQTMLSVRLITEIVWLCTFCFRFGFCPFLALSTAWFLFRSSCFFHVFSLRGFYFGWSIRYPSALMWSIQPRILGSPAWQVKLMCLSQFNHNHNAWNQLARRDRSPLRMRLAVNRRNQPFTNFLIAKLRIHHNYVWSCEGSICEID